MITLIFYGLDEYIVGRLSKEMTPNLAKLYEISEDEINFVSPNNMVFHKGVEQTSWNVLVHVHAPLKVSVLQETAAKLIISGIGEVAINKTIEFYYFSEDNRYTSINEDYPRYITDKNLVNVESEEEYHDEDCDCDDDDCDCHHEEGEGEDDIFTGDIFDGFVPKN